MTDEERSKLFPDIFREALESKGVTRSALAADMGVTTSYVSAVGTGVKPASPRFVAQVSALLGADEATAHKLNVAAAIDQGFSIRLPEDW